MCCRVSGLRGPPQCSFTKESGGCLLQILFTIIFPYYETLLLCDKRDISSKESNNFQESDEEHRKEIIRGVAENQSHYFSATPRRFNVTWKTLGLNV
jgi:hypothetical protein